MTSWLVFRTAGIVLPSSDVASLTTLNAITLLLLSPSMLFLGDAFVRLTSCPILYFEKSTMTS